MMVRIDSIAVESNVKDVFRSLPCMTAVGLREGHRHLASCDESLGGGDSGRASGGESVEIAGCFREELRRTEALEGSARSLNCDPAEDWPASSS